ncbi:glycosyltransferase [Marinobacter sp. W-8]|uniref:glycosyltransferase n=1 Tax=Marinobacter sp. W-8 TaxID=3369658 RepID=UPI0037C8A5FA
MTGHLAIFLPSVSGGGAERVMVILANRFAEQGFKVDLVLAQAEGAYLSQVSAMVNVVDLGVPRVLQSIPKLARYLRSSRPDAMLSALAHANVAAIIARRLSGIKVRLVVSERANLSVSASNAGTLRAKFMKRFVAMAYPFADHVITVSKGVEQDLVTGLGLSSQKVSTVYNPVVDQELLEKSRLPVEDDWFKRDQSVPVVLGVGRLSPQKDFTTLLKAFSRVRAERLVRLVILGEGPLHSELENLATELGIQGDVRLAGFKDNPFPYMRHCSVFVLSSAWEGLPGALIQAMACGAPVVSTDCPDGPAEILENGRWGSLVPIGDVGAMAEAINSALAASDQPDVSRRAMDFTVDQAVTNYLDILLPGHGDGHPESLNHLNSGR